MGLNPRSMSSGGQSSETSRYPLIRTILAWLVYNKIIQENTIVRYIKKRNDRPVLEGTIKGHGILCHCCSQILTVMEFQAHAGCGGQNRPFANICNELQISLMDYMVEVWDITQKGIKLLEHNEIERRNKTIDGYDAACVICTNGGDLLSCANCVSTYHLGCVGVKDVVEGNWLCPYCICKFCGKPSTNKECLIPCSQCEKRYHWKCFQERRTGKPTYLNITCTPVYQELVTRVAVKNELGDGYSMTLLHRIHQEFGATFDEVYRYIVGHANLAIAKRLMEDCFQSTNVGHTSINLIDHFIFNQESHFSVIDFRGFYTAVLEKDGMIISVACLKVNGTKFAEIPLIATCENYRNQGMCRKLMTEIESTLNHLNVENLVILSTKEMVGVWMARYGFKEIGSSLTEDLMHRNALMFHDTVRLYKRLTPIQTNERKASPCNSDDILEEHRA
ncbi:increased DNA methylation 1-like [Impatiens glandulifera]|uniref:increased DNA methylation 1-like n=1 Tax=Impatiens glandulifera TaxID=253017 RepID=UPI001FB151B7|nr:increased DNA methylation 1-like [Impatiens glandulifera]